MAALSFDGTVNVGQIIELIVFFLAGGVAYGGQKRRLDEMGINISLATIELGKITDILIQNAARDEREKVMSATIEKHDRLIESIRDKINEIQLAAV